MDFAEKKKLLEETAELIKLFPESLQERVFNFLMFDEIQTSKSDVFEQVEQPEPSLNSENIKPRKNVSQKKSSAKALPQIVKDLNLRPTDKETLQEFYSAKEPTGNIQTTAVIVYYLQEILMCPEITASHIFTCYRDLHIKIPGNLDQNIRDCASSKYGYISLSDGKCSMSVHGTNFVEQDLPKKIKTE